ncbi:MAG: hypothetical protein KJ601_01990, partial [Nanoarchaeota archaeon]|nr:hypothetical protein [Nanoarchaeota archaeon]
EIEVYPKKGKITDPVKYMEDRIFDSRSALIRFDFKMAQEIYLELLQEYNKLNDANKAKVYESIKELFEERKAAEKLFKKR